MFAQSGSGKTEFVKQNSKEFVDGDKLIVFPDGKWWLDPIQLEQVEKEWSENILKALSQGQNVLVAPIAYLINILKVDPRARYINTFYWDISLKSLLANVRTRNRQQPDRPQPSENEIRSIYEKSRSVFMDPNFQITMIYDPKYLLRVKYKNYTKDDLYQPPPVVNDPKKQQYKIVSQSDIDDALAGLFLDYETGYANSFNKSVVDQKKQVIK